MKRFIAGLVLAAMSLTTHAQSYPSPTYKNVTVQGTVAASAVTATTPIAVTSGGTGVTTATGTGSVVLSTSPTISSPTVTGAFTATGLVTTGDLAAQAANTVVANVTGARASPTAFVMPSCNGGSIQWVNGTGFACAQKLLYAVRDITGVTTTDTASSTDALINWLSTSSSNKTENLPACSSANNGQAYIIKDGAGTSFTYPIAITPASGTIEGTNTFSASNNKGAWTVVCDGTNTNWMVN